jgi:Capsule assembly protein Wzi
MRRKAASNRSALGFILLIAAATLTFSGLAAHASTYVVYIPLDSPIYQELDTLNGLGYLDTYMDEIQPISRIEAARLVLEAQANLSESAHPNALAIELIRNLNAQLEDEIGWLEANVEDSQPTMIHPLDRVEMSYIYSQGQRRKWRTGAAGIQAEEGTPLLPNNDGLTTASGSNEIVRVSGWAGLGGFLTGYLQGAVAGPFDRTLPGKARARLLDAETVLSVGNLALSFGQEQMWWGVGHFGALSQGDNAAPFPALRFQNIHPTYLPGFLRYLGPLRFQIFFGQLDADRYFAHPWIDGQIIVFKPLPTFEFGFTHAIMFGGRFNDMYSTSGFFGRAIGLSTGSQTLGNSNSRAGAFLKFRFPSLRNLEVYQEMLGEDNRSGPIGRLEPFKAVSYLGGFYLPRLTADGLTDLRFEYAILEPNYSTHNDSLYWTYDDKLMGYPLGPNASQLDLQVGRWFDHLDKVSLDMFYTEQAPSYGGVPYPAQYYPYPLAKERSFGGAIDFLRLPQSFSIRQATGLASLQARVAGEYVNNIDYARGGHSMRLMISLSGFFKPGFGSFLWN